MSGLCRGFALTRKKQPLGTAFCIWVAPLAFVDGFYIRFNASSEPKGQNDGDRSATFGATFGILACFSRMRITSIGFIPSRQL